jgi:Flp pilus assembly pilin Flp
MMQAFVRDESGFIVSAELILVSTILVIGLIVGLIELQASILHELDDVGEAIGSLNQSYSYAGTVTTKGVHNITTAGSAYGDLSDVSCCDCNDCFSLFCTNPSIKEGSGS